MSADEPHQHDSVQCDRDSINVEEIVKIRAKGL